MTKSDYLEKGFVYLICNLRNWSVCFTHTKKGCKWCLADILLELDWSRSFAYMVCNGHTLPTGQKIGYWGLSLQTIIFANLEIELLT